MAKGLVIVNNSDQTIAGIARFTSDSSAASQPFDASKQIVLEVAYDHPVFEDLAQWKVSNGELAQKNIVTLTASAPTFPADGTSTVSLTFTGLNASATVQVAGQSVTVSPSDNVLSLTSDAPRLFEIQLIDNEQWSNPVTVEAQ